MLDYDVIKRLDSRNSVFLVRERQTGVLFVKKLIEPESVEVYKKLLNIRHKNICSVFALFYENNLPVVIEEYIAGECLYDMVERRGTLTLSEVRGIVTQCCDGLSCIHKAGIIHRDITPSNIIICDDGRVKIIDMGISRIKNNTKNVDTRLMGTDGYTAPEQFGFRQTDEKADIYSLGVLMNVMLTGEMPVDKRYKGEIVFERVIEKCIRLDPKDRYKTAKEVKGCVKSVVTEKDGFWSAVGKRVPGFRTHTAWKMLIAVLFYTAFILAFAFFEGVCLFCGSYYAVLPLVLLFVFMGLIPWFIATDFEYYTYRIKILKHLPMWVNVAGRVAVAVAFSIAALFVFCDVFVE